MTKNYCDRCNEEIKDNQYMRIAFMGSIKDCFYKNVYFCEKCFREVDKEISKFIPKESAELQTATA